MLELYDLSVEHTSESLVTDSKYPRFSWKLSSSNNNVVQTAYQIEIKTRDEIVWSSEKINSAQSVAVQCSDIPLTPCADYFWRVTVWDNHGDTGVGEGCFSTGFMSDSDNPWGEARWIGCNTPNFYSTHKGVFAIETKFKTSADKVGIIFGADDPRLLDKNKNIMGVEGENRINYIISFEETVPQLIINRLGYCAEDLKNDTLAKVNIIDCEGETSILNENNKNDWHTLTVEVYGNVAKAFVDGVCIDSVEKKLPFLSEPINTGRQLNPLADNDTITFPRLNNIGFYSNGNTEIEYLSIKDIRSPHTELYRVDANNPLPGCGIENKLLVYRPKNNDEPIFTTPKTGALPIFKRVCNIKKQPETAKLFICSRGIYDVVINGENLFKCNPFDDMQFPKDRGDVFLQPGASQFDKHLFYNCYDVSDKIVVGDNALCVLISSGWYCDSQTFSLSNHNFFGDRPSFVAKLIVTYSDKSVDIIDSDTKSWYYSEEGPILYSGYFAGEIFDARRCNQLNLIYSSSYKGIEWLVPLEIDLQKIPEDSSTFSMWPTPNKTSPKFLAHPGEPVKAIESLYAKSMDEIKEGIFQYDMGQNMVGVPYIKIKGNTGDKVWIRYGEALYPNFEEYGHLGGMILTENLRDAESNDIFICSGDEDIFFPRFTFHGYRYVEISGLQNPPDICDVRGVVISSFHSKTSDFSCCDKDINQLYSNIIWSQRANFISIPTDCPQRNERMGWLGDAQVFAPTACYNDDVKVFFERYLLSVRDLQLKDGRFPCIAPIGGGFGGIAWESAGIIIPWVLYKMYADTNVLQENYTAMLRYSSYLEKKLEDNILVLDNSFGNLGDWLATDLTTDGHLIWNAITVNNFHIMKKVAEILCDDENSYKYAELYANTKAAFNDKFFDTENGKAMSLSGAETDTQCAYALPLYYDLFEGDNIKIAADRLAKLTQELDYTLTTGFIGTPCIAPALADNGYHEVAYRLLRQKKYPSWLYPITQGATTIWERWNSYTTENGFGGNNSMNSFNHYSLGAVGFWMINGILGIKPDGYGFRKIIISPNYIKQFSATGYYDSPYGKIEVSWKTEADSCQLDVTIPENTTAKVVLSDGRKTEVGSGKNCFVTLM